MNTKKTVILLTAVLLGAGFATAQTEWTEHPDNPVLENGEPGEWDAAERIVTGVVWDGTMYHMVFAGDGDDPEDRFAIGHATSTDGVTWEMDPNNPVLTRGAEGEWDEGYVFGGALLYDGSEFHLWYNSGGAEVDLAGYAKSPDCSVWTKAEENPVLRMGPPGSFDEAGVWPFSVIISDGTYKMWYTGFDLPYRFWKIGYAESQDGISWTKYEGNPVLVPGREWDSFDVWDPAVVFDGTTYHMWYSGSVDGIPTGIGYAISGDGIEWTKHRHNPVIPSGDRWASSSAVAFDGSTFHMWYSRWDQEEPTDTHYATSDTSRFEPALDYWQYIPAAAVASGAEGSFYQTDVDVGNRDDMPADFQFAWLPRDEDNSEPTTSEVFSLDAGNCARYTNVLTEVFGLEPNSFGALLITASSPDLLAMSRTYNLGIEKTGGTFGQAMPAISPNEFIGQNETRMLLFGTENADMRTNVGCQNGGLDTVAIFLELFDSEGTSLARPYMTLRPLGNDQVNRIFDGHNPVNGYIEISSPSPNASYYCYGSVLDNVTSDPTTIPPQ
jgi:predicted GH43/DUF377 family glycosyl hydrolase